MAENMEANQRRRKVEKTPVTSFGHSRPKQFCLSLMAVIEILKIDPVIITNTLGMSLVTVEMSNLYIEKTCRVGSHFFGNVTYSEEVCKNIYNGSFTDEQDQVQKTVAKVEMVSELFKSVPSVMFALFVGPWSDTFGRKFLLVISNIGMIVNILVFVVNVYFFDQLVVEFLWFESLGAFFGYYSTFWLGVYSFASDISNERTRTFRLALCDAVSSVSNAAGNSVNGLIFEKLDYYGSFGLGIAFLFLSILYTIFVLDESRGSKPPDKTEVQTRNPFSLRYVKEGFGIVFKKRALSMRRIVCLLILCYGVSMLVYLSAGHIEYLYVRRSFGWPEATEDPKFVISWYTQFRSYCDLASILFFFAVLPILTNFLKLHDMTIGIVVAVSFIAYMAIFALAPPNRRILYIGVPFAAVANTIWPVIRSALTKVVGKSDVGKAFASVGAIGSLVAIASPLFNLLYAGTLDIYAGLYLLVIIGTFVWVLLAFFYILYHLKRVEALLVKFNNKSDKRKCTSLTINC